MSTTNTDMSVLGLGRLLQTRKGGQMNRIRGAIVLGLAVLAVSTTAWAQETTGRVTGRVTDQDTGAAMSGVTVIVQGPQGEDATITDAKGQYQFTSLSVGTYVLRFYVANTATQVEQPNVKVSAEKTVRVNVKIAAAAQAAAQQTYVITGKAPTVDVGSARVGATFDQDFTLNLALNPNYGDVITKAPGAFVDGSRGVSIGGATGLENVYMVNGLNVTGLRYGSLNTSSPSSIGGGTNLPTEFLTQIDVNAGGYNAEYGGAMGGVINTVLKNGSNEFHGSVFASMAPYWLSASPNVVTTVGSGYAGVRKLDFDTRLGFEVGGPIIKDKLFFWGGMAPEWYGTHAFRYVTPLPLDAMGNPDTNQVGAIDQPYTRRINELRQTYSYAATLQWLPRPEHKLELSIFGTPNFNNQLRDAGGLEYAGAFPAAGSDKAVSYQESLTRANTDISAHWTSKLFDRKWQVEAIAGMHNEYLYERSPDASLNSLNQIEYNGSDLYTIEQLQDCKGGRCPINPFYQTGGFGTITKSNGFRWSGELKSTHNFEAGGHHELKYGWHLDLNTLDLDRQYSGVKDGHGLVWFTPDPNAPSGFDLNTQNFFALHPNQYPSDFPAAGAGGMRFPNSDLVNPDPGNYVDNLHPYVKSISNALFLQDGYSPQGLRNLTVNAGIRYEFQSIYDQNGTSFLSSKNFGPRLGAIYDPFNDGRSKISASYGRFFEAVPLDIAARYFGGENFVDRQSIPLSSCSKANQNPFTWTGANEWRSCDLPPVGNFMGDAAGGYTIVNNSALEARQPHIQGQYHNEVVATLEREVMEDMTVRLDYTHRWLGTIIEDGYGDTGFIDVLANPGNVPTEALNEAKAAADKANADATAAAAAAMTAQNAAMADPTNMDKATAAANAQSVSANAAGKAFALQTESNTLQTLAKAPKPERTYDALSLTVNKRFSKNWFFRGSYTYSRLIGNYEGLYQLENNYAAPNGTNAYDTPDLYVNSRGRLPNDHPHQGKVDGYYSLPAGPGTFTLGLSFFGRSGTPRNYMTNLIPNTTNYIVFLEPRGSAGRTPAVWQFDGHISYAQKIHKNQTLEAYVDLFNIFNQQSVTQTDDVYSFDAVAPIENGTASDLKYAKNLNGQPVKLNNNWGHAINYQAPFYTRLGLRLMF
jgi:hypothetical protein